MQREIYQQHGGGSSRGMDLNPCLYLYKQQHICTRERTAARLPLRKEGKKKTQPLDCRYARREKKKKGENAVRLPLLKTHDKLLRYHISIPDFYIQVRFFNLKL
jgi:hypothetical protein